MKKIRMNKSDRLLVEECRLFRRFNDARSRCKGREVWEPILKAMKLNEARRQIHGGVLLRRAERRKNSKGGGR